MKNTLDLGIYVCFGSENPVRYPVCLLGLMREFWHAATMIERIPLPSERPYNLPHR